MQASLEALGPLVDAVLAALRGASALNALLDADAASGIHDGGAANPTTGTQPEKYVVVRSPSTSPTGVFSSVGANCVLELHIWYPTRAEGPVRAIAAEIGIILEGTRLTLAGGLRHWGGSCFLIGVLDDNAARPPLKHGIIRYEARVQ